jgi:hypothetical protein
MSQPSLIDSVTERIFFFTVQRAGYEARVVPVKDGVRLAAHPEHTPRRQGISLSEGSDTFAI